MNLDDKITIPAQVMARQVGDETVILDLSSGTYFGLNPVGAQIWKLLGEGKTLTEICEAIVSEYAVARAAFETDLEELLGALAAKGLISVEPGPAQ